MTDRDDFDSDGPDVAAAGGSGGGGGGASVYAAFNAFYDEELEATGHSQPPPAAAAPSPGSESDASDDDALQQQQPPKLRSSSSNKRRRRKGPGARFENVADDSDDTFESQQSILKWVRTVPGPLQDVMKNQAVMESANSGQFASGGSVATGAMISTVFDDGPWVDMCASLGLGATSGKLYGGVRMSSLKHTLSYILEDDQFSPKIPQLLLLIKSMKYVDEEIVAVFHDPTGEIDGYFHRELVEQLGAALGAGTGVLLRKVSVFTPTDATSLGRRRSYLNVIPRNLQRVFLPKSQVATHGAPVDLYNRERAAMVDGEDADDENLRTQEEEAQRLLQHDALRNASTELSYLSQRQVVHRNPPVRFDSSVSDAAGADTDGEGKSKKAKKKSKKSDESGSGLGRWEWGRLAQRKATAPATASSSVSAASLTQPLQSASHALPMSRFTALLSRQIATKRRSIEHESSAVVDDEIGRDDESVEDGSGRDDSSRARVRFADTPVVVEISGWPASSSAEVSENEEVFDHDTDATPQPPVVRRSPMKLPQSGAKIVVSRAEPDDMNDDDDDDDW